MSDFRGLRFAALAAKIAALETGGRAAAGALPFGDAGLDDHLPGGGLPLGRWHEVTGAGLEAETSAAPAAFAASRLAASMSTMIAALPPIFLCSASAIRPTPPAPIITTGACPSVSDTFFSAL